MDLFAFIRHFDPTKARIEERELAEREVGLPKMTEGRTVPLSPLAITAPEDSGDSIDKLFDDADQKHAVEKSDDVLEETIAKDASAVVAEKARKNGRERWSGMPVSLAALRGMVPDSSAIASRATKPLIAAFMAPVFIYRVRSLAEDAPVVTVAVTTTVDTDVAAGSKAKDVSKDFENIRDSSFAGGVNADAASISRLKKTSTSSDSFYASQSLDTETMHCVYIPRWKVTNDSTLDDPYVCLGAMVRMRAEHTLERKGELEDNQLSVMETADAAKSTELRDFKEQNFALEGERSALSERVTTLEFLSHDELNSKVASLEFEIDCLATQALGWATGCAVNKGIQVGLKARINHGKVERDLSMVEAYDPSAEEKYVDAVNALGSVDFSMLSELESKKDLSIVDLMDSLCLEGALAEIHGVENLQPSPVQLMLPIHRPKDNVVFAETSQSSSLEIVDPWVQRFREEAKEKHFLLTDVMTPFVEPLSLKSLMGRPVVLLPPSLPFQQHLPPLLSSLLARLSATKFWTRSHIAKILLL
uniref:Uncharacterized protein n=1 Tax=Tanacetum cinerariifolium TaxID=118510 RepID=A0A6L2LIB8_TANCI|nr:hypothetical protein [Tanacetum cinerariifolium]